MSAVSKRVLAVFAALAAIQIAVPLFLIVKEELILKSGNIYKFEIAPMDPYDPFRGRYVSIRVKDFSAPKEAGVDFSPNESVFARLERDPADFARVASVSRGRPDKGDFILVKVRYCSTDRVFLVFPLDKFFMSESDAPRVDAAMLRLSRSPGPRLPDYVTVKVKNGSGVLEDLFIEDKPFKEWLKKYAPRKT
jgi:uncharacterized membrane-anchored protein